MQTTIQNKNIHNNVKVLQSLVLNLISNLENKDAEISKKDTELKNKDIEIELLRHKLQAQLSARFASKSEKHKFQTDLFDEAEDTDQAELEK